MHSDACGCAQVKLMESLGVKIRYGMSLAPVADGKTSFTYQSLKKVRSGGACACEHTRCPECGGSM